MKRKITAGLMSAAMLLSTMTVPFSVSAAETPDVVGAGEMMTTAACNGVYFNSNDFTYLYVKWNYTLYSNNDMVITADTYQTPFDNEQTEMVSPLMTSAYSGEESGLLLGAIGYNGTTDIEAKSIDEKITLCDYREYGTNPDTSVEFETEASYWENKYEIRYSGSQFPETVSNAGKKRYNGEHLIELTFHNWTADEFCLAGHLIAARDVPDETEEKQQSPSKNFCIVDLDEDYEKFVTDENGDKHILNVYTWSSPKYIYRAVSLSHIMYTIDGNEKVVLASWDRKGSFSCDGILYENAVNYHYEVLLYNGRNAVTVTAELTDNLILPENESGTYLLEFGEVCHDLSVDEGYEINSACLGLEGECDSITVGNHTVLNGKYIDTPPYPAPSQAEMEFAEKQNQSLNCLSISARYSSPEIQKENEGLFFCVIEPSIEMFSTPFEYNKQYGQELDAPFTFTAFGTTYALTYRNGGILVNPSNLESGYQDEDFAEVDTFSAPEYVSVAEELPVSIAGTGDVSGDGTVDVKDAVMLQKYLLNTQKFSYENFTSADMNHDGKVNVFDLALLKRKLISER